jgi:hypothetical protein
MCYSKIQRSEREKTAQASCSYPVERRHVSFQICAYFTIAEELWEITIYK